MGNFSSDLSYSDSSIHKIKTSFDKYQSHASNEMFTVIGYGINVNLVFRNVRQIVVHIEHRVS